MYLKKRHCHQFTHPPINYWPGVPREVNIWAPIIGREAPPPHRPAGSRCRNHQQLLCTHFLLKYASSKALVIAAIIISSNVNASKNQINFINHITFDCNGLQCLVDKKVNAVEGRMFSFAHIKIFIIESIESSQTMLAAVEAAKCRILASNSGCTQGRGTNIQSPISDYNLQL